MRWLYFSVLLIIGAGPAAAQWSDDFSDGEFSTAPPWTGTPDSWTIINDDGRSWLRSNGAARSDTIVLATTSAAAHGSWSFRFRHRDVNLSNFNGARVFLIADTADLRGPVFGYYLQFGTNNSNEIRLVRIDGDPSRNRVDIGRSLEPVVAGTSNDLHVSVYRSELGEWHVWLGDQLIIQAEDATYAESNHFGIWIKHTAPAAASYFFTDFRVDPSESSPGDGLEPRVTVSAIAIDSLRVLAEYSHAMSDDICETTAYRVVDGPPVAAAMCESSQRVELEMATPLDEGTHELEVAGVRDSEGTLQPTLATTFRVTYARGPHDDDATDDESDHEPPMDALRLLQATYTWRSPGALSLEFSHALDETRLQQASFELDGLVPLNRALTAGRLVSLEFEQHIADGARILRIGALDGPSVTRLDTIVTINVPPVPSRRDLVVNEIHYDPPDQAWEFIEVYNRSELPIDVSWLDLSDDRLVRTALASEPAILEPGGYMVFVRDGEAFTTAFPGIPFIQPPTWHALNNSGDAVIIYAGEAIIDSVAYASSWGGRHVSLERIDPTAPSVRANFASSVHADGATPGALNSVFFEDPSRGRITTAHQIDERIVVLQADRTLGPAFGAEVSVSCAPAAVESVETIGDEVHVGIGGGRPIRCRGTGLTDALERPIEDFDVEVALLPEPGELLLNEIMFDPLNDPHDGIPDQPFYVEIISLSSYLLSMQGVALTGPVDETGGFTRIAHERPHITLRSGGLAVFSAEGAFESDVETGGLLALAFPTFAPVNAHSEILPVRRSTLGIRRGGDEVRLIRSDSVLLDAMSYHPSMHHPALIETRGRSIERRSTDWPSGEAHSWASSTAPQGGTPGTPNTVTAESREPLSDIGMTLVQRVIAPESGTPESHLHIQYRLRAETATVRARVFDSRGRLVRTLEPGRFGGAEGHLFWDGHGDESKPLRVGIYIIVMDAVDETTGTAEQYRDTVVLGRSLR
jgi:hypothetical protein